MSDSRADVGPDFSPNLVGATSDHPIALNADGRQIGVVAKECQRGPPGHPHRETGGQHHANHGPQGGRPSGREPSGVASQSRARINARTSPEPAKRSAPEPETIVSCLLIVHPGRITSCRRDRGVSGDPSLASIKSNHRPSCSQGQPATRARTAKHGHSQQPIGPRLRMALSRE